MEDRILINGVWYVRESDSNQSEDQDEEFEITWTKNCLFENQNYYWEASRMIDEYDDYVYDNKIDFCIKFTDKTTKPWKTDIWDNPTWVLGVYGGNPESMKEAMKDMDEQGIKDFRKFIKFLIEKEWLSTKG